VEKASFTTVTNTKCKSKGKVPPFTNPSAPFQNIPTSALVVSKVPPLPPPAKTVTVDGDQREFDHKTKVITNESKRISQMFHNCALNK